MCNSKIDKKYLGIFERALKDCELRIEVWGNEKRKTMSLGLSYNHVKCGSNGCDLDIRLIVTEDAEVYEE